MKTKLKIKPSCIITFIFFSLLLIGSLNNLGSTIGFLSLLTALTVPIFIYFIFILKNNSIYITHGKLLIYTSLLLAVQTFGALNNLSSRAIEVYIQFVLLFLFMLAVSMIKWDAAKFKTVGRTTALFIIFNLILWALQGFPSFFSSYFNLGGMTGSNTAGAYFLYLLFFLMAARKYVSHTFFYNILIALSLLLLYFTNTRSAFIALFIGAVIYIMWSVISKTRIRYLITILSLYFGLIISVLVYPLLPHWKYYQTVELISLEYTGKSIMSGRSEIWYFTLQLIENKLWFGHGTGIQLSDLTNSKQSPHNLYLQFALENGILGLLGFFIMFTFILMVLWKSRELYIVKLSVVFIFISLIHQSFESTLTQNNLPVGALQWLIIGIGLSAHIYNKKKPLS